MTLIVSLRIPDGIVIAGDSLSTLMTNRQIESPIDLKCPQCSHVHNANIKLPVRLQSNSLSYAQKIFPFMNGKFGIGTFGEAQLTGKTIYFAMREYEKTALKNKKHLTSIHQVAKNIGEYIQTLLLKQLKKEACTDNFKLPENYYPIGFQIVGYDKGNPVTIMILVGNDIKIVQHENLGISYNGKIEVIESLFSRFQNCPAEKPVFELFSLQDAIIYSEYLINTTAVYQRFSVDMATVGGDVDIALLTPFDGYKWIKQKTLQTMLSGGIYEENKT